MVSTVDTEKKLAATGVSCSKDAHPYGSCPVKRTEARQEGQQYTPSKCVIYICLIGGYTSFGGGALVSKFAVKETNPVMFELLREGAAGIILGMYSACMGAPAFPKWQDLLEVTLSGVSYFVVQIFFFLALKISDPVCGAAWQTFVPILATLMAVASGREYPTRMRVMSILVGTAGASLMVFAENNAGPSESKSSLLGHVLFAFATFGTAMYFLIVNSLSRKYPAITINAWNCWIATVLLASCMAALDSSSVLAAAVCSTPSDSTYAMRTLACHDTTGMFIPLLYEVLLCSCVFCTLLVWVSQHTTTSTTTAFQVVNSASCAAMSAMLFLSCGDVWSLKHGLQAPGPNLFGIAIIAISLIMLSFDERQQAKSDEGACEVLTSETHATNKV